MIDGHNIQVMDTLLGPFEHIVAGGMMILHACGHVVRETESYDSLVDAVRRCVTRLTRLYY